MIDPRPESTETETEHRVDSSERLPWVTPRLDSIKFQDAQAGIFSGGTPDGAGTHS
jgi:hypothetical protein